MTEIEYRDACMHAHSEMFAKLDEMSFGEVLTRLGSHKIEVYQQLMAMTIHYNKSFCKITGVVHPSEKATQSELDSYRSMSAFVKERNAAGSTAHDTAH